MRRNWTIAAAIGVGASLLGGCAPRTVTMAPPVSAPPVGYSSAPPVAPPPQTAGVYQWQDVPVGQNIPIARATFDQGGYQIFATTGETIVVPFVNQNLYAMKFGRINGQPYFVNNGDAPVLYLQPGGYLENAAAQNARWYPIPNDYAYGGRPIYVSLAPSWNDYVGMGWYPGMSYYGGMWGYNPYAVHWMPGFYVSIGGNRYTSYNTYRTYYTSNPGYMRTRTVYSNYSAPRSTFRSGGSTGSFSPGRSMPGGTTGSFSPGRSMPGGTTGSFSPGRSMPGGTTGSFAPGSRMPSGGTSGSFTPRTSPSMTPSGGSFNRSSPGFSNTPRTSGGSFMGGGSRPSGGSFSGGGSRPSGGSIMGGGSRPSGGSFSGGGSRPSGGSFGGRRR